MRWYQYIAYFFGGAFLVNSVPHFTNGVSGRSFATPSPRRQAKDSLRLGSTCSGGFLTC